MSTFDTHGGYFAPKDYMKVESGGTHEENPNGGVQIGVDQQGVPNLLEEGEPVYKDYVYSDNIKASERFLKDNNIPEKYAGELYSKIADSFFSEAENRPNDPISRNGLEAMLGRLADAQEAQKAYNEERQLKRELESLSPDELAALGDMLSASEQQIQPDVVPEQVQPEMIAPEQVVPEQVPVQPVMRNGGNLYKWGDILNIDSKYRKDPAQQQGGYALYPMRYNRVRPAQQFSSLYDINANPIGLGTTITQERPVVGTMQDFAGNVYGSGNLSRRSIPLSSSAPVTATIPSPQNVLDDTNAMVLADIDSPRRESFGLQMLPEINGPGLLAPVGDLARGQREDVGTTPQTTEVVGNSYRSTLPRYAGAIGSGLLGLYNAFQSPDRYTATRYRPFVPSGRINLQDQVYNPVDQNMMLNQTLAQGNSAVRAIRNSGIGPSTAAAIIAQDNNITGNLGNTFLQTWDANNQRRNQVIAANNQNEAQRAQFDYTVDAARQRALAEAQYRNAQNDLMLQRLNYGAEGDKYAAISNQISNALQALSGIGQENYAMNQVNSNTANEGYGVLGGGIGAYLPYYYRRPVENRNCGGKIQRKKK